MPKAKEGITFSEDLLRKLVAITEANVDASKQVIDRVDKLVELFEEASKHVTDVETTEGKIKNLSTKLEELIDQNRTIAQGLLLLEKYVRGKTSFDQPAGPKPVADYGTG